MSKKSHHFLTLWPWPLTYDLEKLIRSGHYHYQCVYQIWEQSIPWFLSYRVNTIAGGGRLRRKTITSPDTGDITTITLIIYMDSLTLTIKAKLHKNPCKLQYSTSYNCQEHQPTTIFINLIQIFSGINILVTQSCTADYVSCRFGANQSIEIWDMIMKHSLLKALVIWLSANSHLKHQTMPSHQQVQCWLQG